MPAGDKSESAHVYKFGGTSVATAERIQRVVELVNREGYGGRRVVVVSALGGVTDELLEAIDAALARTGGHNTIIDAIIERHAHVVEQCVAEEHQAALTERHEALWVELRELIHGVSLVRECTMRTRDAILSVGERASAPIVAAAFRAAGEEAIDLDARSLIRTDDSFGEASVLFDETNRRLRARFDTVSADQVAVVTGFIAATDRDVITTLGRSGSDYTATILGAALDAGKVIIWTDVDGVLSADPRLVPEAGTLDQLSYREAAELAYFGANVLHPRTMRPLQEASIPLLIKNTLKPDAPGTLISADVTPARGHVKGITSIRDVAVVMIEGRGMIGVPGIAARAFSALAAERINVLVISQASSEQNICIVVRATQATAAVEALRDAFELERARGDIHRIFTQRGCAVISAVGDQMRQRSGLAGRMFATLGRSGVNVLAIAQGASETNISAVVRDDEVRSAVRALHEAFALARDRAHVFLLGRGVVGSALLKMMHEQAPKLIERMNLNLRLVGIADTQRMLWDVEGVEFDKAEGRLDEEGEPLDLSSAVQRLQHSRLDRLIVVDATAADVVADQYPDLLSHNVAVVTPNKRANARDQAFYDHLQHVARENQVPYLYETTVGAGLPVLSTLRDLRDAGDRIERIEGVFSGTLAFIFNSLSEGMAFSAAVREAKVSGYTEPDPRDDLRGEDVARKLMVLAREMGYRPERADVEVESLVPDELLNVPVDVFMQKVDSFDAIWEERVAEARKSGGRLQYVGRIDEGRASVQVEVVDETSPFYALSGTANMIVYTTEHYRHNPLVVQGPGAGPRVTAAGVLADIIRAAQRVS